MLCQGDVSEDSAVLAMRERPAAGLGPVAILGWSLDQPR